jgi:hypothetical protein
LLCLALRQLKKKYGDGGPLIQGPMVIEYLLSCQISCEGVCRITTLPFSIRFHVRFLAKGYAGLRRYRLPIRFNHR